MTMFRTAIARSARLSVRCARTAIVAPRATGVLAIRWNSNEAPKSPAELERLQKRAAWKETDRLQADWKDENILTYEQLLPKTESPTPVRLPSCSCQLGAELGFQETFLIDVREPDETVQGMIPSAVNVPLSELSNAFALPAVTWKEKFNFEKPRRDQEVIFYCRSGKRSSSAADVAKRNGFTKCVVTVFYQ